MRPNVPRSIPAHISGSRNVPFPTVLEASGPSGTPRFKSPEALREVFASAGADLDGAVPLVGSCGSGLTACVLALAVYKATGKLVGCSQTMLKGVRAGVSISPVIVSRSLKTSVFCLADCSVRWIVDGMGWQARHADRGKVRGVSLDGRRVHISCIHKRMYKSLCILSPNGLFNANI